MKSGIRHWRRIATTTLVAAGLLACAPPDAGPALLDDYLSRVQRTVGRQGHRPATTSPSIVAAQLSKLEVPADTISLLDFLSLSGCELQHNLGRRNSHLGRNASPSQRLLLDLEFLRLAPACIERLEADQPDLAAQLTDLVAERDSALSTAIYNAVLAGPEWRSFWRLPNHLGDYPATSGGDIGATLNQLADAIERWLTGDRRADGGQFELLLSALRAGDGGPLLLASQLQHNALGQATTALQDRFANASLCPFGSETDDSKRLRTIAAKYFAGGVQPWLADLRRREALLMPPVHRIENALADVLPREYRHWRDRREQTLAKLLETPRQHALQMSDSLADCGGVNGGDFVQGNRQALTIE